MYKIKTLLPLKARLQIYHSFVQSHINFCSLVWGFSCKSTIEAIFCKLKKGLRAVILIQGFSVLSVIRYRIKEISTVMLAKQYNLSIKELMATGHVLMSMRIFKSGKNQHCPSMPMSLTKITSTSEILK